MGLYFVWYDEKGEEEKIVEVTDYKVVPFTRPEQINRNTQDIEPIPTAQLRYTNNLLLSQVPASQLQPIVPSPVNIQTGTGSLEINNQLEIQYGLGLQNEANYLASSLKDLTGSTFKTSETASSNKSIRLNIGQVKVNGVANEAYTLKISKRGYYYHRQHTSWRILWNSESAGTYTFRGLW
jgi:hexosaminidase